jgi:hypothetical protein
MFSSNNVIAANTLEAFMAEPINEERAARARKAIATCGCEPEAELATSVSDILTDLGHLCDAECIDFVERVKRAINTWAVERIDPLSLAKGPRVEIVIRPPVNQKF